MTIRDVLLRLLQVNPEIAQFHLLDFPSVPLLQERETLTAKEENVVQLAQCLKAQYGLPFWDSVLACSFESELLPKGILAAARFHNGSRTKIREIAAGDLAKDVCFEDNNCPLGNRTLAISSLVYLRNGSRSHIPMIDFHCPASTANRQLTVDVLYRIPAVPGYLVESGDSYHFYGERLLEDSELSRFLGTALLFTPIVDRAWIAHQLIQGFCGLRVSGRPECGIPRVVSRIN